MDYAHALVKATKAFYNAINPATLSGAIDVVVVEQPDGEYKSTPFHIRFGKVGVWSHNDKFVDIEINGEDVDFKLKLGVSGNATPAQEPIAQIVEIPPQLVLETTTVEITKEENDQSNLTKTTTDVVSSDLQSVEGTLRLSSAKLKSLGLRYGSNEARFSITTMYQGTSWCACNIYLYKWYEQLVVSDIDGTITKSDVLGHVLPAIGGQWAHNGIVNLYSKISDNGYKIVYLSSRAIGQSHMTKQYIKSLIQNEKHLPDGPVLLSPSSILVTLKMEVIEKRPDEFKISVLNDLKKLFPVPQPFYAGFGNRDTDVKSYRAVQIPSARILVVDPSGIVRRSDRVGYESNYLLIAEHVDYLFPPLHKVIPVDFNARERSPWQRALEHSNFTHWKTDHSDDIDLDAYEKARKKK